MTDRARETLRNRKLSEDEFFEQRQEVLAQWPTGKDVDLDEAIAYQKSIMPRKNAAMRMIEAEEKGQILMEARGGFATVEQQIELGQVLEASGVVILPTTIDTYTRNLQFKNAQAGLEESIKAGRSLLNGFPVVSHGVQNARRVIEAVNVPTLVRATGYDNRLLWEVSLAAGFSGGPGNDMSYFGSGCKKDPIETIISTYQYINRLCGYYEEHGVPVYRESHGVNIRSLMPPSVFNAFSVLITLLSAEQGVRHIGPTSQMQGHIVQDVAAIQALMNVTRHYLVRLGYHDVHLFNVLNSWGGAYPTDEAGAFAIICLSGAIAALADVTVLITKSPQEGIGVPTPESNAAGGRASRLTAEMFRGQTYPEAEELRLEREMVERETHAIIDRVLELGDGDLVQGAMLAFEQGVLDAPFSPNIHFADLVMAARDAQGAVRFLDTGNLPFGQEIKAYHAEKLAARADKEKRPVGIEMTIEDVQAGILPAASEFVAQIATAFS